MDGIGEVTSTRRGSGARYNTGKTPFRFIPLDALEDAARVFEYGAEKYADWNWAKGMDWSVPYECALRHLDAWYRGEDIDAESGLPHIGHIMCNMIMLAHFAKYYKEGDDRPPSELFYEAV